jgi:hypothetical protein
MIVASLGRCFPILATIMKAPQSGLYFGELVG